MEVRFGDLRREYFAIKDEIDSAVKRVLESGWFILGKELEKFEEEFAKYCGVKYGVGVASGTEAIALALMALDIGPGDEVITVSHTAVPTATGISMTGATPVFADIEEKSYLMHPEGIEKAITKRTKAILPVHLYGQMCDMEPIMAISQKYGIPVVEDAAQAHGAEYKGKRAGNFGIMAAYSFYPSKNLGAYGDGGMVVTNDKNLYDKLIMLRNYGQEKRYYHKIRGLNSRLDEMQAAILRVKLKYLEEWNERRREIAKLYNELLEDSDVITPIEKEYAKHVYHLYVIRVKEREKLQQYLSDNGIQTLIHYPIPIHLQKAYKTLGYKKGDFPITEKCVKEILSLPIYPELMNNQIEYTCKKINEFYKREI